MSTERAVEKQASRLAHNQENAGSNPARATTSGLFDTKLVRGCRHWCRPLSGKFSAAAARLADRHYSRRKLGSPQFMPPGQTIVLLTADAGAVFGWCRPDPTSGVRAMNGLDGWTCTIFRREAGPRASELVLDAERALLALAPDCGPDGMLTYVWDAKVRSTNAGYCFKAAGWRKAGRSADDKKTLLVKPFELAGLLDLARATT